MEDPCRPPPPVDVFDSKVIILPTLDVEGFSSERVPESPVMEDAALTEGSTPRAGEVLFTLLNKLDIGSIRDDAAGGGGAFKVFLLEDVVVGGKGGCLLLLD